MSGRSPYKDRVRKYKCPVDDCDYKAVFPRDISAHEKATATVKARMKDKYQLFRCEHCGKQYCTAECCKRHECVLPDLEQADQDTANAGAFDAASTTEAIGVSENESQGDADDAFGTPIASRRRRRTQQLDFTSDTLDEDKIEESAALNGANAPSFQQDLTADQGQTLLPPTADNPMATSVDASRAVKCPNKPCAYLAKNNSRMAEHVKIAAKNVEKGGATHVTCSDCGKSWCTKRLYGLHDCEAKEGGSKKSTKKVKPAKAATQDTNTDVAPISSSFIGRSQQPRFASQSPSPMPTPSKPPKMAWTPKAKQEQRSPGNTEPFSTYYETSGRENSLHTTPLFGNTIRPSPFVSQNPSPMFTPSQLSKQISASSSKAMQALASGEHRSQFPSAASHEPSGVPPAVRQSPPYGVRGGLPVRPETRSFTSGDAFVQPHFGTNKVETETETFNAGAAAGAPKSTLGHWEYDILVRDCPNNLSSELNAQEEFAAQLGRYVSPEDFVGLRGLMGQTWKDHVFKQANGLEAVNLQWRPGVAGPAMRSTDEEIEKALAANDYLRTLGPTRKIFQNAARSSGVPGDEAEKQ